MKTLPMNVDSRAHKHTCTGSRLAAAAAASVGAQNQAAGSWYGVNMAHQLRQMQVNPQQAHGATQAAAGQGGDGGMSGSFALGAAAQPADAANTGARLALLCS